ncbi:MAG: hypothetical protein QXY49_05725 [Thermofilaceae archaeon]
MAQRRALKLVLEKKLIKVTIEDANFTIYATYSKRFDEIYVIIPRKFCSCPSYLFDVFTRQISDSCIHLLAMELAGNSIQEIKVSLEEFISKIFPLIFRGLID